MTKIEKAQCVAKALYKLKKLPQKDNINVKRIAKYNKENMDDMSLITDLLRKIK